MVSGTQLGHITRLSDKWFLFQTLYSAYFFACFSCPRSSRPHAAVQFTFKGKNKMAEVHTTIKSDASGNLLKFDNPGVAPLAPSAGKPVTATTAGGPAAHGTVNS